MQRISGYLWATGGISAATAVFWLARLYLDKGQASLLYLPVVIACAVRFGFGPAVLGACLSFLCWDFFFLPPFDTFVVADPKDWISLFVFLLAAVTTAQLASQARLQTQQAQARETEIAALFQASEALSQEVRADSLLSVLAGQLQTLCRASSCYVFRRSAAGDLLRETAADDQTWAMAKAAYEQRQVIGFGSSRHLWAKALGAARSEEFSMLGVAVPLLAEKQLVGVLHVGPRHDGRAFSHWDERLILTLSNHAAVVVAREEMAVQAAQAEALREADVLKDALLSLVSHELRTPLATIKASASSLRQPGAVWDDEMRAEALAAINSEADRLSRLVGNLLDLSRIEAGAWRPQKDWCDIGEIIGTALGRLPDVEAVRVQVGLADNLPMLRADDTQLTLVLTNLLENAIKYTPPDTQIYLKGIPSQENVLLTVRDFGPGLTPGEEDRLFERFYRGQAHQQSAAHGTGLGLALCQAIIQAHGGRLWATNAPPGEHPGAVFTVVLPQGASRDYSPPWEGQLPRKHDTY